MHVLTGQNFRYVRLKPGETGHLQVSDVSRRNSCAGTSKGRQTGGGGGLDGLCEEELLIGLAKITILV